MVLADVILLSGSLQGEAEQLDDDSNDGGFLGW